MIQSFKSTPFRRRLWWASAVASAGVVAALLAAGCASGSNPPPGSTLAAGGKIQVVAAENFWGSIAAQLGGQMVSVTSIIKNPATDPHSYEATPGDARAVASAQYVILNGFGYDPWMEKLTGANAPQGQVVLNVQTALGQKMGDNPHVWYSPTDVTAVIGKIVADYKTIDPAQAAAFDQQERTFVSVDLQRYTELVAQIKQKYAGTPIGATESIATPLAKALGLDLISPAGFLRAITEGTDPTAQDKATFDAQIQKKQIAVLLFNTQNATPDVQRLVDAAKSSGIAVVGITETLTPETATFQDWQSTQLQSLADALARATGK